MSLRFAVEPDSPGRWNLWTAHKEVWKHAPDPGEGGNDQGNDGDQDPKQGEAEKPPAFWRQVRGLGCQLLFGCFFYRFDVQTNIVLKDVRVEDDPSAGLETFPDHPPKGNSSKGMSFLVPHRSTSDIC